MSRSAREPRQRRSQETLDRILVSAEELFCEAGSADVGVREICFRAQASSSSFYARLPERSTLHRLLFDRFTGRVLDLIESIGEDEAGLSRPFDVFATGLIDRFTLHWYREAGLIRALAAEEREDPELLSKRQWLEREILRRALGLAADCYPEFDLCATEAKILDALPSISAAFRGAAASPDQLGFDAPDARERLVRDLSRWVLAFAVLNEPGVAGS